SSAWPGASAWGTESIGRGGGGDGGRRPRKRAQYHASASSIPPRTAPPASAASARSTRESPASSSASRAAASARRSARERRNEPPNPSGTSAAIRHRKPSVSMSVTGRIAQAPALKPFQYALTPVPNAPTTPTPLTAFR